MSQGRVDESVKIIKHIAKINKRTVPDEVYAGFRVEQNFFLLTNNFYVFRKFFVTKLTWQFFSYYANIQDFK